MIKVEASLNLAKTKIENIEDRVHEKLRVKSNKLKEIVNLSKNEELNISIETLEKTVQRLLNERESLGAVNLRAEEEMNEMKQKIELMSKERIDLELAIEKLTDQQSIDSIQDWKELETNTAKPLIEFVEYITPPIRPGIKYRAFFKVNKESKYISIFSKVTSLFFVRNFHLDVHFISS